MALTPAQRTTFKADIEGNSNQTVIDALAAGAHNAIATWYNQLASPQFVAWKTNITRTEIYTVVDWAEVVNIKSNDLLAFQIMMAEGQLDPSQANVRNGFSEIFRATGNNSAPNTRTALVALNKRDATEGEKVFSTGTGSTGDPAVMDFEGSLSATDVSNALNNG